MDVEISSLDLRYEDRRVRNRSRERRILASIIERGIEEPLAGVEEAGKRVLLDGFQRYRCARKLSMRTVPYRSLGSDAAEGIVALLRPVPGKPMSILEQAALIDELRRLGNLSAVEIAGLLSRSKAWVSVRMGLFSGMSAPIRQALFSGRFPAYAYMYTVRRFMRINPARGRDAERFVTALSGKALSYREIDVLAQGYFHGTDAFREQVLAGKLTLALESARQRTESVDPCSRVERGMLSDLGKTAHYIRRVTANSSDARLKSQWFYAEANLLSADLLSQTPGLMQAMEALHDRSAKT